VRSVMRRWKYGCNFFFFFFTVWRCREGKLKEHVFMLFGCGHLVNHPGVPSGALERPHELFNFPCNFK
jgi:hypothetical protein